MAKAKDLSRFFCHAPTFLRSNWWPFFTVIFYILSPLPTIVSRRYSDDLNTSSALKELCYFLTTGIVLSSFALPIVLARAPSGEKDTVVSFHECVSSYSCMS